MRILTNYYPFLTPEHAETLKGLELDMYIAGKALPIASQWGAIPWLVGENCRTGPAHEPWLHPENTVQLDLKGVLEKTKRIREGVKAAKTAGVKRVLVYMSMDAIIGDPNRQQPEGHNGFWDLYDNWTDYGHLTGPKPEDGPGEWLARDRDGLALKGYGNPKWFEPLKRFHGCPNHPSWMAWLHKVIEWAIRCGYEGVFLDNPNPVDCFCEYCKLAFRDATGWCEQLFRDYTEMDPFTATPSVVWGWRMYNRWIQLLNLRQKAREQCPTFIVVANINDPAQSRWTGDAVDWTWFEWLGHPKPGETDATNRIRRVTLYRLRKHTRNIIVGRPEAGVGEHRHEGLAEFKRYGFKGGLAVTKPDQFLPEELPT